MKHKSVLLFIGIILLFCIITGFIYGNYNSYDIDLYLKSLGTHENDFVKNILIVVLFLFSTFSIIGIILECIFIGIEGISFGYVINLFYTKYKFKGILFSLIHFILNRFLMFLIMIYLFYFSYMFIKKIIINIFGKRNDSVKNLFVPLLKKYVIIFFIVLINCGFIYMFSNSILKCVASML